MKTHSVRLALGLVGLFTVLAHSGGTGAELRNLSHVIDLGGLPLHVHVFEDYETDIEKRWWLRGVPETNNVAPSLSDSVANRRAFRATATKDFDDKMGDPGQNYKGVVFNPVPGPPMGANTRLSFGYWLEGTDTVRVQIYSLSKGYHRFLMLTNLPQGSWRSAAVDMKRARRPDGSGGSLAEDERIDDIQFYIAPEAELLIDDIVLYDAAATSPSPPRSGGERMIRDSFPKRIVFTGWFDTGQQGAGKEWPGEFEIVKHTPPLTWKAAKSVVNHKSSRPWVRLSLRGQRPLGELNRLNFRYRLAGGEDLQVVLANSQSGQEWRNAMRSGKGGNWTDATLDFKIGQRGAFADELRFEAPKGAELFVDDVLLFEPGTG